MKALNTILIVDDQQLNRYMMRDLLKDDYDVLLAENGKKALEIIEKYAQEIAVILLDIVMPVMDGYEVLEHMRKEQKYDPIPVIIMTQSDDETAELRALELGATEFVKKPFKSQIIKHKINNIIALRRTTAMMHLIAIDSLTGLNNKEAFYQKVEERLHRDEAAEYDMIALDIEKFKLINDSYGVSTGDDLLKFVANGLKRECELCDGVCGRISGDHFVLLHSRNNDYKDEMTKRLVDYIAKYPLDVKTSISIGIYEIEDIRITISGMCDRAFLAADQVKGQYGKRFALYDDTIRTKMLTEQYIQNEMQESLEKEQFQVFLQPKYSLLDDSIAGAEALVRWFHPVMGMIAPDEFIPLFEKSGFITELDYFVWDKTCQLLAKAREKGNPYVPISVNVSRRDIYNEQLPEMLVNIVEKYSLDKEYLHLEITETAYTENPEQLISVVGKLKQAGFIIEMDDFGSGYSSLNMLSELPIDILKLDMKFIHNETKEGSHKRNILSYIISLAKWMKLAVVAEGVETLEQVDHLRKLNCDYVQGYYFAKPMEYEDFQELLKKTAISQIYISNDEMDETEEFII